MPFKNLIAGYKSFHQRYFSGDGKLYRDLVRDGQSPETLVIACSDSRSDPAILTDSSPGDMFVIRNVAAIVPPYKIDSNHHGTSAAIEFAVRTLKVKHIVVMGHSLCGGVHALAHRDEAGATYEFLQQWIDIGRPALETVERELADAAPEIRRRALEEAVVLVSLNNLLTFPWIKSAVDAGALTLHGWYFDLTTGGMFTYDAKTQRFGKLTRTKERA